MRRESFVIAYARGNANGACRLCGMPLDRRLPLVVQLVATQEVVCQECANKRAPALAPLVELFYSQMPRGVRVCLGECRPTARRKPAGARAKVRHGTQPGTVTSTAAGQKERVIEATKHLFRDHERRDVPDVANADKGTLFRK